MKMREESKVATDDLNVSANVAYGQVKKAKSLPVAVPEGVYEELGALVPGGGATEYATCAAETVPGMSHTHTLIQQYHDYYDEPNSHYTHLLCNHDNSFRVKP